MKLNNIHISRPLPLGSGPAAVELEINLELVATFQKNVFPSIEMELLQGERQMVGENRVLYKFQLDDEKAKLFVQVFTAVYFNLHSQTN